MSFWTSTLVKSGRKQHRCEPCGRLIPAGQASYSESGVFEGEFLNHRLCLPCHAFIERHYEYGNLERGEWFEWDWLPDIARDAGEPWPPASVDTLPKGEDAKRASCASKGSAVAKPDAQHHPNEYPPPMKVT